jgi:hypothetical protein
VILGSIPELPEVDPGLGGLRTIDVYVPTLVLVALIVGGLQAMPPVITGYRERGILRRMSDPGPARPRCCPRRWAERRRGPAVGAALPGDRPARLRRTTAEAGPSATRSRSCSRRHWPRWPWAR